MSSRLIGGIQIDCLTYRRQMPPEPCRCALWTIVMRQSNDALARRALGATCRSLRRRHFQGMSLLCSLDARKPQGIVKPEWTKSRISAYQLSWIRAPIVADYLTCFSVQIESWMATIESLAQAIVRLPQLKELALIGQGPRLHQVFACFANPRLGTKPLKHLLVKGPLSFATARFTLACLQPQKLFVEGCLLFEPAPNVAAHVIAYSGGLHCLLSNTDHPIFYRELEQLTLQSSAEEWPRFTGRLVLNSFPVLTHIQISLGYSALRGAQDPRIDLGSLTELRHVVIDFRETKAPMGKTTKRFLCLVGEMDPEDAEIYGRHSKELLAATKRFPYAIAVLLPGSTRFAQLSIAAMQRSFQVFIAHRSLQKLVLPEDLHPAIYAIPCPMLEVVVARP